MPESGILSYVLAQSEISGGLGVPKCEVTTLALHVSEFLGGMTTVTLSKFLFCAWFACTVTKSLFKLMIVFK